MGQAARSTHPCIGISGWRYRPWRGDFYPDGLTQKNELAYASRRLNGIEINGSFYGTQTPARYAGWATQTPDGFRFSVKAPRYITHVRRLRDIAEPLKHFMRSGPLCLGTRLGPFLWQFPPSFGFDPALFDDFLAQLPRNVGDVLPWLDDDHQMATGLSPGMRLRHAVEIRHPDFLDPAFIRLLRRHGVALVIADTAGKWPYAEDITAGFVYLRLHGDKQIYTSGYSRAALRRWAARIRAWQQGEQPDDAWRVSDAAPPSRKQREVFCFFDNDVKVRAPYDALQLAALLGQHWDRHPDPGAPLEEA